jgi:hypothetical protein
VPERAQTKEETTGREEQDNEPLRGLCPSLPSMAFNSRTTWEREKYELLVQRSAGEKRSRHRWDDDVNGS